MPLRVVHLTRDFPPRSAGGVSAAVGGIVARGLARGEAHAVVSFDSWRPATSRATAFTRTTTAFGDDAVDVLRVTGGLPGPEVSAFVAAFQADEVQVHDGRLAPFSPSRPARVQVVHVLPHLQDHLRGTAPTLGTIALASALDAAERVVVTTEAARSELLSWRSDLAARVVIEALAPTLPRLARAPDAARHGPIMVVSRFDHLKGTDLVAAALPALVACREVVLAGGLPENPKAERRWLARLDGARFVGWLAPPALAEWLARAALVIAPSRVETCGLAALEAAAAGALLVASDIPAHREVVPHARFFASGDAQALSHAVRLAVGAD